MIKQNTSSSQ